MAEGGEIDFNKALAGTNLASKVDWILYLMIGVVGVVSVAFVSLTISVIIMFMQIADDKSERTQYTYVFYK